MFGNISRRIQSRHLSIQWAIACLALYASGCATTTAGRDGAGLGFEPFTEVAATQMPVVPRTVSDLLRDAEEAFRQANEAHESGDEAKSLRHYALMLELLVESDLDPAIFYSLRNEFSNILNVSVHQAREYERSGVRQLIPDTFQPGKYKRLQIPFPLPERVHDEIEKYQTLYADGFQAGLDRSHKYLPYVQSEFEKAGLPKELAWLAMIESAFKPRAVSRASAGGMWQFMRGTGRNFNLRIDGQVDERFDWQSATRAAIEYLQFLHDTFDGNWPLALTGYNMGENGLERVIAANGGERDLWRLIETPPASNLIRLESKQFFAKFVAALILGSNPEEYGFKINPQPPEDLKHVPVKGIYALSTLDQVMGYAEGTLAELNPDLLGGVTASTGDCSVAVSASDSAAFVAALRKAPKLRYSGGTHRVARGETISHIAQRYRVSQAELMRVNNVRSPRSLRAGQVLRLPGYAQGGGIGGGFAANTAASSSGRILYTVKRNDTLWDIAGALGVTVGDLRRWNSFSGSHLRIGAKLYVSPPGAATAIRMAAADSPYHIVRAGEYPALIAKNYDVSLQNFLRWNNLTAKSLIRVSDKLLVKAATEAEADPNAPEPTGETPVKTEKIVHYAVGGDSAYRIAEKYGVGMDEFLVWNGLNAKSIIFVGRSYEVYVPAKKREEPATNQPPDERLAAAGGVSPGGRTIHIVEAGQNPSTIARGAGVPVAGLFKWNNWSQGHVLQIGDEVIIYRN